MSKMTNLNKTSLKPFVKWAGGKSGLLDELLKKLPTDLSGLKKYAEPMVGGGALFFYFLQTKQFDEYYISDINPELINVYKTIKNKPDFLIEELDKMQTEYLNKDDLGRTDLFYKVRELFNSTQLSMVTYCQKASWFIFLNKTCFNGLYRVNKKGEFNVPHGSYKNPLICDFENIINISKLFRNVIVENSDYSNCNSFVDNTTLVYFDPPYRPISQTSAFTSYNNSIFDDDEQFRLSRFIDSLNSKGAKIILSNSDPKVTDNNDNFFDDLYTKYNIERVKANRMINCKSEGRGSINELLISNF